MVERVFISAVTSEFGAARAAIAADLRARGVFLRAQGDFRQEAADTWLGKDHPRVARDLNSLAALLQDSDAGRVHPHRDPMTKNQTG